MFFFNRDLNVDSVGELTIWHGNEFLITLGLSIRNL